MSARRSLLLGTAALLLHGQDERYPATYRDLAKLPLLDRKDLLSAAPASHRGELEAAMAALEGGNFRRANGLMSRIVASEDEPAAEYLLGRALYRERKIGEAKVALLKAETMAPRSGYRCWSALQIALITGDLPRVRQECDHLQKFQDYAERAAKIGEEVRKRG